MARTKEQKLATARAWKAANKDRRAEYRKRYFQENKTREVASRLAWGRLNPDKLKKYRTEDYERHGVVRSRRRAPKQLARCNRRYRDDLQFRIVARLRASLNQALRRVRASKAASIGELIGCAVPELRAHIEAQFKPGMSWSSDMHIDHIRPCASFDLTDPDEQRRCFHYTNLQPLWASENMRKGARGWARPRSHPAAVAVAEQEA